MDGIHIPALRSSRLTLRALCADDHPHLLALAHDPEVMRYIRDGPLSRVEAWWQIARYVGHWQLRGYGMWAVVERSTNRLIGHIGFLNPEGGLGFELGWALARHAWGRGYALEGTRAAVQHAFTALNRDHIACVIRPENDRSIHLAERLGATLEGETEESGRRLAVYGIHRPEIVAA